MLLKRKFYSTLLTLLLALALGSCEYGDDENKRDHPHQGSETSLDSIEDVSNQEIAINPSDDTNSDIAVKIITADGFENVTFGMTEAEAISSFKGTLEKPEHLSDEYKNCYYLGASSVAFMVHHGKIERIDIWTSEIATKAGARVGMTAKSIEDLYPDIQNKPNFYTFPIQDLIVEIDGDTKIIFEQNGDGVIERFRIGKTPAIDFVEGCL